MSLPESLQDRIKRALFKILNIPVHAIEASGSWVEREGSKLVIKIETDIHNIRQDWKNNVNYINDVETKDGKRIYTFRAPSLFHQDLETLHKATTTYNLGKEDTINKVTDKLMQSS